MRTARRVVLRVVGVGLLAALVATGWLGVRGVLAYRHLQRVQAAAPALEQALTSGDTGQAADLSGEVQANAAAAERLTGDPVWRLAGHLPVIGRDLAATHALAHAVDGLGTGALPQLTRVAAMVADRPASTGPSLPADLQLLHAAGGEITTAQVAVDTADTELDAIQTGGLYGPVAAAVTKVRTRTTAMTAPLATASRAAAVLPAMLDPATPKTYLLLFQNLAEARSLGGIVGAYAVVQADAGTLTLTAQGSGASIKEFSAPVLPLDPGYGTLFADQPARYLLDTTTAPYFPDTARLAREMWRRHSGQTVDGVLSVDPVALSYLLAATGPVTVPGGPTVDSADAAQVLMHDIYAEYPDPATQDAVFARTAAAVFGAVTSYRGAPRPLLSALARGAAEHRLLVWSAEPALTRMLAGTAVDGIAPTAADGSARDVGVYLDDATSSKLSWYWNRTVSLHAGDVVDGHRLLRVQLVLGSTVPARGRGVAPYVLGSSRGGVDRVVVLVLAPGHAVIVSATVDGRPAAVGAAQLHGRSAITFGTDLAPGARRTVEITLLVGGPVGSVGLDLQPLVR